MNALRSLTLPIALLALSACGFHGGSSICLHSITTKSGPDGRFTVPGWWRMPLRDAIVDVEPVSYAFVPEMVAVGPQSRRDHFWMPGPGVHVMRRPEPGESPTRRENAFINAK